ncbi:MAG: PAS domain-containing sensor histidine kinase [Ignavibacteria bacterium]|nr:PAS domain-containing sensor histidine kinase [Ignavibacteria bacterium]
MIENYKELISNSLDPVIILQADGKIVYANSSAVDFFLIPQEQFISKSIYDFFEKDKLNNSYILKAEYSSTFPITLKHIQVNNEYEIIILKKSFNQSALTKLLCDNVQLGIVVFNKAGKIEFYNNNFLQMWGLDKNTLENYNIFEDEILISSSKLNLINEVIENSRTILIEGYYDSLLEKGKGFRLWLESIVIPIQSEDKTVTHFAIIHKDISEIKLAKEELLILNDKLTEANRLRTTILANLSHEIRTPLNSIIGYSDIITQLFHESITSEDKKIINHFKSGMNRLMKTLTQLMEISQIDSGDYQLELKPINLNETIKQVLSERIQISKNKEIETILKLDPSIKEVIADPSYLNQVLLNLIDNAYKFTKKGSVTIETFRLGESQIAFCSIKDTGVGIESKYLDHLFEPFSQEKIGFSRPFEGNGLGLTLTKKYIELMNGSITVESTKDVGSNFTFTLPLFMQ